MGRSRKGSGDPTADSAAAIDPVSNMCSLLARRVVMMIRGRNTEPSTTVRSFMRLHADSDAHHAIRRRGGTAVIDLLEPYG